MIKKISILGSTGSVGRQTLEVAEKKDVEILALSAKSNIKLLELQIRKFKPKYGVVFDANLAWELKKNINDLSVTVLSGIEGLCHISSLNGCDLVFNSLSGMIGLMPTIAALESKIDVALSNKEVLVAGGEYVMKLAKKKNVSIIPVDSEHSAIFQCLQGCKNKSEVKSLILTASGGPFWDKSIDEIKNATVEEALRHPNWSMGPKITVDCATMMNKGLEIIEAVHLFGIPEDRIKVLIHRESIVHSMVEYKDNSVIAQMGPTDMKLPLLYALYYPNRVSAFTEPLDLTRKPLTFHEPRYHLSKCMDLCRRAVREGGSLPVVLNAANEEAVRMFLDRKIMFFEIEEIVENAILNSNKIEISDINDIIKCDLQTRDYVKNYERV